MENPSFAEQLVFARKAAGLTQEQLGERMHMSRQGISHWETGRALPDAETLKQLSQVLNYNFVTSEALQWDDTAGAEPPALAADAASFPAVDRGQIWRSPVLWLSVAVVVLALALVIVLLQRDGYDQTLEAGRFSGCTVPPAAMDAPADRAEVRIIPAQNPIVPSYDPVLGSDPWWITRLTIQEVAGVDFTIEKMTFIYHYMDGSEAVVPLNGESVAANSMTGSNVLHRGVNLQWNDAQPLLDFKAITVRLDGTDAKGNVLSFENVIICERPVAAATPTADPQAVGRITVQAQGHTVAPQVHPDFGEIPMWIVTFDILEVGGVPVTVNSVTVTAHGADGWQNSFDAAAVKGIFGTNVIPGGSALPWTVANNVCALTAFTVRVEAVDANGNVLVAEDTASLLTE